MLGNQGQGSPGFGDCNSLEVSFCFPLSGVTQGLSGWWWGWSVQSSYADSGRGPLEPPGFLPVLLAFPELSPGFWPRQLCQSPRLPVSSICRSCKPTDSPGGEWEEPGRSWCGKIWGRCLNRFWCPACVGVPMGEGAVLLNVDRDQP